MARLVLISDTHNNHDKLYLPEGDILIHSGDATGMGYESQVTNFIEWMEKQDFENHTPHLTDIDSGRRLVRVWRACSRLANPLLPTRVGGRCRSLLCAQYAARPESRIRRAGQTGEASRCPKRSRALKAQDAEVDRGQRSISFGAEFGVE